MTKESKGNCGCGLEVGSEEFINKHVPKCEFCGVPNCYCECKGEPYD